MEMSIDGSTIFYNQNMESPTNSLSALDHLAKIKSSSERIIIIVSCLIDKKEMVELAGSAAIDSILF